MWLRLLKAIGWVTSDERDGIQIDYDNSWCIGDIRDRNAFLSHILDLVPDGSVWAIEGIYEEEILARLGPYETNDDVQVLKGTMWPRQITVKILLDAENKKRIKTMLPDWDLNVNFTHQHIYHREDVLFTSFDNLHDGITYLSRRLDRKALEKLIQQDLFAFVPD
jgi:hypothetical protein